MSMPFLPKHLGLKSYPAFPWLLQGRHGSGSQWDGAEGHELAAAG